jgi:hypothetical protein
VVHDSLLDRPDGGVHRVPDLRRDAADDPVPQVEQAERVTTDRGSIPPIGVDAELLRPETEAGHVDLDDRAVSQVEVRAPASHLHGGLADAQVVARADCRARAGQGPV